MEAKNKYPDPRNLAALRIDTGHTYVMALFLPAAFVACKISSTEERIRLQ